MNSDAYGDCRDKLEWATARLILYRTIVGKEKQLSRPLASGDCIGHLCFRISQGAGESKGLGKSVESAPRLRQRFCLFLRVDRNSAEGNRGLSPVVLLCSAEIVLPSATQHQPEMDHADSGLESGADSLYYPVRRPDEQPLTNTPFTQNSGHPPKADFRTTKCQPNFLSDRLTLGQNGQ
jgi:hypothetical protein